MAIEGRAPVCTVKQAAVVLNISTSKLNFWDKTDFIRPSVMEHRGRLPIRYYTFQDLVALRVANQLREAGISLQALREVVHRLQAIDGEKNPLAKVRLVAIGDDVYECRNDKELISMLKKPGQSAMKFVLDLKDTVRELESELQGKQAA